MTRWHSLPVGGTSVKTVEVISSFTCMRQHQHVHICRSKPVQSIHSFCYSWHSWHLPMTKQLHILGNLQTLLNISECVTMPVTPKASYQKSTLQTLGMVLLEVFNVLSVCVWWWRSFHLKEHLHPTQHFHYWFCLVLECLSPSVLCWFMPTKIFISFCLSYHGSIHNVARHYWHGQFQ